MKPVKICAKAHPAELNSYGTVGDVTIRTMVVNLFTGTGPRIETTITSLDALEPFAAEVAKAFGKPCAVWISLADRSARSPRGFDAAADAVGKVYREPVAEVAS